ncbi:MAG: methionine gamma-lyase family protein, partial [Lachnospiraceae bacterium]|nr:methionine gamma-lyase family protein [Lachnospiraceae bacterium]
MNDINLALNEYYKSFGIEESVYRLGEEVLKECSEQFDNIDRISELNQIKVLKAFRDNKVSEACLMGTSGYGYNDLGRETLEKVYASVFKTED